MASSDPQLHFILVPFMAQGHMIPMVDIAKLLASQGAIATIAITQHNALRHKAIIDRAMASGLPVRLLQLRFPSQEVGLPEGCESVDTLPSPDYSPGFFAGNELLGGQLEESLAEIEPKPDCLISDAFIPWTVGVASKFQIPRVIFHGTCCFSLLCIDMIRLSGLHESADSSDEPVLIPNMPRPIQITKDKFPATLKKSNPAIDAFIKKVREGEESAYGVLINSFEELEPEYVERFREARRGKAWCIGSVSLCHKDEMDLAERGNKASIEKNQCLKWLDSREPNSVLYVCLGSLTRLIAAQLIELGTALEASEHPFIWVIREGESKQTLEFENWLSREGFEERNKDRGLLIKGWAPQMLILSHQAIGGFLTHCGWNSTFEALGAGVPMITWPLFGEQFFNEKVIVDILKVGYRVGVDVYVEWGQEERFGVVVKREEIERGVRKLMDKSEENEEMRMRAKEFGEMGRRAMESGGSSHLNLSHFIQDIVNQVREKAALIQ
ncbi:hypothetical protein Sjap_013685 [Stephania japonica]|uniref:Glycosyltransferase n=1 Tax=Stephania japonica TaxID=461633 RepID=A0AAP0J062_9MAGN